MRVTPFDDEYVQVEAEANGCTVVAVLFADHGPFTSEGFVRDDRAGVLIRCADGQVIAFSPASAPASSRLAHDEPAGHPTECVT